MATVNGTKYAGPLVVDVSPVKDDLVDLAQGEMRGMRAEQEGLDEVLTELSTAVPAHGDDLNVPPQAYKRVLDRTALLATLRAKEIDLEKLLEVVRETRAKTENDREDDIALIAQAAQKAADKKKDQSLAAPFAKTIKYNSQIADKAAHTRKKNEEAKAEAAKNGAGKKPGDP